MLISTFFMVYYWALVIGQFVNVFKLKTLERKFDHVNFCMETVLRKDINVWLFG